MSPAARGTAAERAALVCGKAGCGRCCACGAGAAEDGRRLIAFPVRGEKRWLCPGCLAGALDAARRPPAP